MACRSGIGTTLSGAVSTGFTPLVRSISGLMIEREMFDCTVMTSPQSVAFPGLIMREYAPGDLGAPGQLTVGILSDPDEWAGGTASLPIDADPEAWTIEWRPIGAQTNGATFVWTGFMVSVDFGDINYDGLMEGQAVFQPSGDIVMTAGS